MAEVIAVLAAGILGGNLKYYGIVCKEITIIIIGITCAGCDALAHLSERCRIALDIDRNRVFAEIVVVFALAAAALGIYFKSIGDETKAGIIKYNTNKYITLYRLGNLYNYFYTLMPTSTGVLKDFDLTYIKGNGFILRFPTIYIHDKIKKYEHHPNMFDVFAEFKSMLETLLI